MAETLGEACLNQKGQGVPVLGGKKESPNGEKEERIPHREQQILQVMKALDMERESHSMWLEEEIYYGHQTSTF